MFAEILNWHRFQPEHRGAAAVAAVIVAAADNTDTYDEDDVAGCAKSPRHQNRRECNPSVFLFTAVAASCAGPGSNPACAGIFSGSSHTSDLKNGTPVATLPGAWRYRVSTGTGRPGVSILWLGEVERWICNVYLSVAAGKIVWADPSLRHTSLLLGR